MSDTSQTRIHAPQDELVPRILVRAVMALILAMREPWVTMTPLGSEVEPEVY